MFNYKKEKEKEKEKKIQVIMINLLHDLMLHMKQQYHIPVMKKN